MILDALKTLKVSIMVILVAALKAVTRTIENKFIHVHVAEVKPRRQVT